MESFDFPFDLEQAPDVGVELGLCRKHISSSGLDDTDGAFARGIGRHEVLDGLGDVLLRDVLEDFFHLLRRQGLDRNEDHGFDDFFELFIMGCLCMGVFSKPDFDRVEELLLDGDDQTSLDQL